MFLFVLTYVSAVLFIAERYKRPILLFFFAFAVYFLVAGLQFDVGTDYFSYIYIYETPWKLSFFLDKGEYLFYFINVCLAYFDLPAQSLFLAVSFLQSLFIFMYLYKIKKYNFIVWIFFIAFFSVTNIYNNQLNTLRQFLVVTLFPLLTLLLYERKYLAYCFGVVIGSFFHQSALVLLIFIPLRWCYSYLKQRVFAVFCVSVLVYLFLSNFIVLFTKAVFPEYVRYFSGHYLEGVDVVDYLTKIYYLPGIFYFYYLYSKQKIRDDYFNFAVFLFSVTYWFFILGTYISITNRMLYYCYFFYAFPMYYLLCRAFRRNHPFEFFVLLVYVVAPYIIKTTILARAEFLYNSILF